MVFDVLRNQWVFSIGGVILKSALDKLTEYGPEGMKEWLQSVVEIAALGYLQITLPVNSSLLGSGAEGTEDWLQRLL